MKLFNHAVFSAAAVLSFVACSHKPVQPKFETLAVDTLVGTPADGCQILYNFATITNTDASEAFKAIEEANIAYFFELEGYTGTAREAAQEAIRELSADLNLPHRLSGSEGQYEVAVEAEAAVVDSLLVYAITRSCFTGGAHGIYGTEIHTYSIGGGYELMLLDFYTPEQVEKLVELIRTKLYEQYNVKDDEGLSALGFFPETITTTENFRITEQGITFCYNPYDIGCYALGSVDVTIDRSALDGL